MPRRRRAQLLPLIRLACGTERAARKRCCHQLEPQGGRIDRGPALRPRPRSIRHPAPGDRSMRLGRPDPGLRVSPRPPWASCRWGRDRAVPAPPQATRPGPGTPLGPEDSTRRRGWRRGSRQGSQRAPAKAALGVSLPCPSSFCPNRLAIFSLIPFHPSLPCISSYLSSSMSFSPLLTPLLSPLRYFSPISPSSLLRLPSGPPPCLTQFTI